MRHTPTRKRVNKQASARTFRHHVGHTHPRNMAPPPMRGGYRM